MNFLVKHMLPLYALSGLIVSVYYLSTTGWAWSPALEAGGRDAIYGLLITAFAISGACGHLLFPERVVSSLGHKPNDASRLFQRELGLFTLMVAVASFLVPAEGMQGLGIAWGGFLVCAGLNHLRSPGRLAAVLSDLICGALLLTASV